MSDLRIDLSMDSQEEIRCRLKFRDLVKEYRHKTHFSLNELECLCLIHYKLTKKHPMDRKIFRRFMYTALQFQNDLMVDRIFSAFDRENKLVITPESWVRGMSIILRGTLNEKIRFCFRVYDMMNEGFLKKESMFMALKHSFRGQALDEDPEEYVRDLVEYFMKKMDLDRDGVVSFEDYKESVLKNPHMLEVMGYCLPARPAVHAFLTTFTDKLTKINAPKYYYEKHKFSSKVGAFKF